MFPFALELLMNDHWLKKQTKNPQVPAASGNKSNEQLSIIRMTTPPTFQPAPAQKTAVVKVDVTLKFSSKLGVRI